MKFCMKVDIDLAGFMPVSLPIPQASRFDACRIGLSWDDSDIQLSPFLLRASVTRKMSDYGAYIKIPLTGVVRADNVELLDMHTKTPVIKCSDDTMGAFVLLEYHIEVQTQEPSWVKIKGC